MPTFHDMTDQPQPTPPPGQQDLNPTLPGPPVAYIGGVPFILERVAISDLAEWRRAHGFELHHTAWMGRLGFVSVCVPENSEP